MADLAHETGFAPPFGEHPNLRVLLVAPALALGVFAIDTFTDIESAIAVLYVLVLLVAADALRRRGIILLGVGCAALAVLSFAITHHADPNLSQIVRCGVALSAIAITTALLLRNHASKQLLVEANDKLRRSEARYRGLFEQARFSLWEQDFTKLDRLLSELRAQGISDLASYAREHPQFPREAGGLITTINVNGATVELLGASSRAEVLGSLEKFLPSDDPVMIDVLQALFDGRDRFEGKGRLLTADGRELTVLVGINFPEDRSLLDRVAVGIVDITQREQTQQALMATQAELARVSRAATIGEVSASIAHELNQPLGALVMNSQACLRWLRRDPPDLEAAKKAAERTARDGKRASEIVHRTRELLVKGWRPRGKVNLRELIDETVALLDRELAQHDVAVRLEVESKLPRIEASRVEIQQVLINLVTNALHAMEATTSLREIVVAANMTETGLVRVAVRDHGAGIGEADLAKLFDPFFTTKAGGMGMGLAICRSTIEAHHGALIARNHEEGGAIFEFVLPVAPQVELSHA